MAGLGRLLGHGRFLREAAHEQGVIHRDIKPANILLGRGGALVADFGIALAVGAASGRQTRTGITPGTPTYLSPEQLTGDQPAGPRSDIYALGCVLYEMLAGEPPFGSLRSPTVLAKVLTEDAPRLTAVRKSVPPNVDAVVARSLEKLPADRFASAADFAAALGRPDFRHLDTSAAAARMGSAGGDRNRRRMERAAWVTLTFVLAGSAARGWLGGTPDGVDRMAVRTSLDLAGLQEIHGDVVISPDGSRFAVSAVVDGRRAIWTRRLDEPEFRTIPGTENGFTPAFSPDGAWVVFRKEVPGQTWLPPGASSPRRSPRGALVKADVSGGGAITLVDDPEISPHHPYWAEDGTILYSSPGANLVSATGSNPRRLPGVRSYNTQLLPGGHAVVGSSVLRPGIQYVDLDTDSSWVVVPDGRHPKYIDSGFLLYARVSGGLYAVPFDAKRGRTTGDPIRVVDRLAFDGQDRAGYAISGDGTLVYREGIGCCGLREAFDCFVRFDAGGKADTVRVPHKHLGPVRFSPDGRSLV